MAFVEDPFSAISWFVCQLRVELGFRLFARNGFDTYAIQAQYKSLFSHQQLKIFRYVDRAKLQTDNQESYRIANLIDIF